MLDPSKFKSTIIDADINKKNNAEFLKSNDFVKEETSFEENDKLEDMVHSLQSFGNNLNDEEGIQDNKFNEILEFKDYKLFQDCTNLNGISPMSSNAMEPPTLTSLETPPIPKRKSDSIFDPLMSAVSENEYFKLPEFITNQISLIQLNEVVQEFNDAITDKRFLNDASINELSVQDLKKLSVEKRFIKPSLTALLFLEKLDHRDEVASHDSQNLTKLYRVKF
ncbi:hypothetical protein HK099_003243 [Clydaea vesicula]|uniref:Uncharacterized protein n=1 Tax=Clydaea vesicula TaxID=447962 RepID=A0AAD5U1T8_9FUNG|nr:hypothetical protein HK099_003243 [Clydaea vesicula]